MKKTALIVLFLSIITVVCHAGTELKVGTYNIKSYSSETIPQHQWNNRKGFIVKLVKDNAYDVIGMNEIRSINHQHDDINALMADAGYGVVEYNDSGANACYNSIFYKKSKIRKLDEGMYFLSPDGTARLAWDMMNSLVRFTTWGKFEVIETGEIFYYFETHHDVSGSIARYEETRLNIDKIREISGMYPAMFSGDFNTVYTDGVFYGYASAYMQDSRMNAENVVIPDGDGTIIHHTVDGVEKWEPIPDNTTRLDFIFVKGASKISEYRNITTRYTELQNECPSDHSAIQATLTLESPDAERYVVYVDPAKDNLQDAVNNCAVGGKVLVKSGKIDFSASLDITHSVVIEGGYNDDFSAVVGKTEFSATDLEHVITVSSTSALTMKNMDIHGGKTVLDGGGIYCLGRYLGLFNCDIHDNVATRNGAGVYASGQLEIKGCNLYNNVANGNGGAFFTPLTNWHHSVLNTQIHDNTANIGPAGFLGGFCYVSIVGNSVYDNKANTYGTMHVERTGNTSHSTFANNTFARNTSAGIASAISINQPANGFVAIVNNTIVGNMSQSADACAVHIHNASEINLYNNIIAGNKGGDIKTAEVARVVKDVNNIYTEQDCATKLSVMFAGKVEDDFFVPEITSEGIIPMKLTFYGDCDINDVTDEMLREETFNGDVDNNAEMLQRLVVDQTGTIRRTDGTSTRGAVEIQCNNAWDGVAVSEPKILESGEYKGFYLITTPEELAWVAQQTETSDFDGSLYIANDINLNDKEWHPIGGKHYFNGSIEGNNRKIYGLNISASQSNEYVGLIGKMNNSSSTIHNLRVAGRVEAMDAKHVGSVVAKADVSAQICSVHSSVDIIVKGQLSTTVGSIVADATDTRIEGCSYSGNIVVDDEATTGVFDKCTIRSNYFMGTITGKFTNIMTATLDNNYSVDKEYSGVTMVTVEQLHNGELARKLDYDTCEGLFGQDLSDKASVPVTANKKNKVFETLYLVNEDVYERLLNNEMLMFPAEPEREDSIFLGWYNAEGIKMTTSDVMHSDTTLYAHFEIIEKWDGVTLTEPSRIDDATSPYDGWYQINKATELAWVAARTKTALVTDNLYITTDIDLDHKPWTPLGVSSSFNGNIEGNGHTIKNVYLSPAAGVKYYGFIGQTNNTASVIANLNVTGLMKISTSNSSINMGGLIGKANGVDSIINCHSKVDIVLEDGGSVAYLGGLIGLVKNTQIVGCSYSGTMTLSGGQVAKGWAGLIGTFNSTVSGHHGGLRDSWFAGCINSSLPSRPRYGAALVGYPSLSGGSCYLENNYACGTMTCTLTPTNYGVIYALKGTGATFSNNYSVGLSAQTSDGAIMVTDQQLHNGELCWGLNGDQTSVAFGQDLTDGESIPVNYVDGMQVYRQHFIVCDTAYSSRFYNADMPSVFPAEPVIEGNKFLGWFDSPEGGEQHFENTPVTENMILYAHFEHPTGIEDVSLSPALSTREEAIYNLQGVKVNGNYRGLIIREGKKFHQR